MITKQTEQLSFLNYAIYQNVSMSEDETAFKIVTKILS